MALFWTDSLVLTCSNVETSKRWWIEAFDCKGTKVPTDWDDPLPSDVALQLPGYDKPAILLRDQAEVETSDLVGGTEEHPIVFCSKLQKAREHLLAKGVSPGEIQEAGGTQFFEVRDPDGTVIEICKEP